MNITSTQNIANKENKDFDTNNIHIAIMSNENTNNFIKNSKNVFYILRNFKLLFSIDTVYVCKP